jgi:hypothetical protein
MPRATGRKGPRAAPDPRNESGASTVAGSSRPPAAAARRPRPPEDDDNDEEEVQRPPARQLRDAPGQTTRFAPYGTPIATGHGKRKRRPPARPDDSPDPHQRRRCDRCERMQLLAEFTSARGQLATCRECRDQVTAAREENRRRADEDRAAGLRALFREFGKARVSPALTLSVEDRDEDDRDDNVNDGEAAEDVDRARRPRGRPLWPARAPDDWTRPRGLEDSPLHQTEIDLAQAFHDDLTEIGAIETCTRCDERWPLLGVNGTGACRRCQNGGSRHARMFCATNYRCARLPARVAAAPQFDLRPCSRSQ